MSGLWVVVSGATSGIGRAIVRRFLAQGLRVLALARDVGALTILAAELGALQDLDRFAGEVETAFASELARRLEPLEPAALGA